MDKEFCIVVTTFGSEEQASDLLGSLVEEKMAACIQIFPINSIYFWNDKVCRENEILVFMKTRITLYEKIKSRILEAHPYDTPEVIRLDIEDGAAGYLDWIRAVTRE